VVWPLTFLYGVGNLVISVMRGGRMMDEAVH